MFYNKEDLKLIVKDRKSFEKELFESNGLIIEELKNNSLLSFNDFISLLHLSAKENNNLIKQQLAYLHLWNDFKVEELSDENKIFISLLIVSDRNYHVSNVSQQLLNYNDKIIDLNKSIVECLINDRLMEKKEFIKIADIFKKENGFEGIIDLLDVYSYEIREIVVDKFSFIKNINQYSINLNKKISFDEDNMEEMGEWLLIYEEVLLSENIFNNQQLELHNSDILEVSFFVKNNITDENIKPLIESKRQLDIFVHLIDILIKISRNIDSDDIESVEQFKKLQHQLIDIAMKVDEKNIKKDIFKEELSPNLLTYQLSLNGIINNKSLGFLNKIRVSPPLFTYNRTNKINTDLEIGEIYKWGELDTLGKNEISVKRMNDKGFIKQIIQSNKLITKFEGLALSSKTRIVKFNLQKIVKSSCFEANFTENNGETLETNYQNLQEIFDVITIPQYSFNEWLIAHTKLSESNIELVSALNKYSNSLMMNIKENKLVKGSDLSVCAEDMAYDMFPLHIFKSFMDDDSMPYEIALFNASLNKITDFYYEYKNNVNAKKSSAILSLQEEVLMKWINNLLNKFYLFVDELKYVNEQRYIDLMSEVNTDKIIALYDIVNEMNIKEAHAFWENKEIYDNNELTNEVNKNEVTFYHVDVNKINRGLKPFTNQTIKGMSLDDALELNPFHSFFIIQNEKKVTFTGKDLEIYGLDRCAKYMDNVMSSNLSLDKKREQISNMLVMIDSKFNINDVSILDAQIYQMRINELILYVKKLFDYAYKEENRENKNLMSESLNKLNILNKECNDFVYALIEKSKEAKEKIHPKEEIVNIFMKSYESISVKQGLINKLQLTEKDIFSFVKVQALNLLIETEFFPDFYLGKGQEVLDFDFIQRKFIHAKEYVQVLSKIYNNENYGNNFHGLYTFLANKIDDDVYEANDSYLKNTMYGLLSLIQHNQEYSLATKQDMYFGEQLNNNVKNKAISHKIKKAIRDINKNRSNLCKKINKKVLYEDIVELALYETSLFDNITENGDLLKPLLFKSESFINFIDELMDKTGTIEILEQFFKRCDTVNFEKEDKLKIINKMLDILPQDNNAILSMLTLFSKKESARSYAKNSGSELLNFIFENCEKHKNIDCFYNNLKNINFSFDNQKLKDSVLIKFSSLFDNNNAINYTKILTYNKEIIEKLFDKKFDNKSNGFLLLTRADKKFNNNLVSTICENSVLGVEIKQFYEQLKKESISEYFINKTMSILMDNVINYEITPHLLNNSKEMVVVGERNNDDYLMIKDILEKSPKSMEMFDDLLEKLDKYFAEVISSGAGIFLISPNKRKSIVEKYGNIIDENIKNNAYSIANQNSKVLINMTENYMKEEDQLEFMTTTIERKVYSKESFAIIQKILENQAKLVISDFRIGETGTYSNRYKFLVNRDFSIFEQLKREKELFRRVESNNKNEVLEKRKKKI